MFEWTSLVRLIEVGFLGASLAFLLLSYNLLVREQDLRDAQGNPVPMRKSNADAIYWFMRYSLIFFLIGIISQTGNRFTDYYFSQKSLNLSRLKLNKWSYNSKDGAIIVGFGEQRFEDLHFIKAEDRGQYNIIVAVRPEQTYAPHLGEYNIAYGPYAYAGQEIARSLTDKEIGYIKEIIEESDKFKSKTVCTEFVLFALPSSVTVSSKILEKFMPSQLGQGVYALNKGVECWERAAETKIAAER